MKTNIVDLVAETIYRHEGGSSNDEEWEMCHGEPIKAWNDIAEWQRDDYRIQAKAVLKLLDYKIGE